MPLPERVCCCLLVISALELGLELELYVAGPRGVWVLAGRQATSIDWRHEPRHKNISIHEIPAKRKLCGECGVSGGVMKSKSIMVEQKFRIILPWQIAVCYPSNRAFGSLKSKKLPSHKGLLWYRARQGKHNKFHLALRYTLSVICAGTSNCCRNVNKFFNIFSDRKRSISQILDYLVGPLALNSRKPFYDRTLFCIMARRFICLDSRSTKLSHKYANLAAPERNTQIILANTKRSGDCQKYGDK